MKNWRAELLRASGYRMQSKTFAEFAASIIETLEALNVIYAVGGSIASSTYGETRPTADIDISILLPLEEAQPFVESVQRLGYYVFLDSIVDSMINKLPFNIIDSVSGYKADMFLVEPTPLESSILARCRREVYDPVTGASAMLYSPEDVIIYKLKYYLMGQSQKHLRDIAAMLIVQGAELDYIYIAEWAQTVNATELWSQLLDEYQNRSAQNPYK